MNILIVANHYAVCSARYAADAFKRLGHDVRHIGPEKGREIWGLALPAEYAWKAQAKPYDWTPDLSIVMDSDEALLNYADSEANRAKAPVVVYGVDNHVRDYRRPCFNHYFLAHNKVSIMPMTFIYEQPTAMIENNPYSIADFIPRNVERSWEVTHLPCAYDPQWFTPSAIPFAQREYDVCMIGVLYPQRVALVDALRKAGLKVLAGTGLVYEAYRDAHHNSRIALCSSVAGDVAQRVFESAAMGCAVLSDRCADFTLLRTKGVAIYNDVDNAVELAHKLLANKAALAQANVEHSQAWAAPHTWDARAQVIVRWWEANYATAKVS